MNTRLASLFVLAAVAAAPGLHAQYFVNAAGPAGNGSSWSSPFIDLEQALAAARTFPKDIWIAEGVYRPTALTVPGVRRSATFSMVPNIAVYGAFLGFEPSVAARQGQARLTLLDGDIGVKNNSADNAYNVVTMQPPSGPDAIFLLDSVTVLNGNANPSLVTPTTPINFTRGGGVFADGWATNTYVSLTNVSCNKNNATRGGGLYAQDLLALNLLRCSIQSNTGANGAGMYSLANRDVRVVNGVIRGNVATADGGGVFVGSSSGSVTPIEPMGNLLTEPECLFHNCLVEGNSAQRGGGFHLGFDPGPFPAIGMASLVNCTVVRNDATTAGWAIFGAGGLGQPTYVVRNSILWDNGDSNLSPATAGPGFLGFTDLQGPLPAGNPGNFSLAPLFENATNYRLQAASPCLGAGSLFALPADWLDLNGNSNPFEVLPLDLDMRPRLDAATGMVDCGAFER